MMCAKSLPQHLVLSASLLLASIHLSLAAEDSSWARVGTLAKEARAAYKAGNSKLFLEKTREALELAPKSPTLLYNTACGYSLTGDVKAAASALERVLDLKLDPGIEADSDLAALRDSSEFPRLKARIAALHQVTGSAEVAFQIREPDYLPEGIAFDSRAGVFFVSSVRNRRVDVIRADGSSARFSQKVTGTPLAVLGMKADSKRRLLWAATAAVPQMKGYTKSDSGKTALLAFDLDDGKQKKRILPPDDGKEHSFNDVEASPEGEVYVSDSTGSGVFVLKPGQRVLETFVPPGVFVSPNGLALDTTRGVLYVSDYARGIFSVDVVTRDVSKLEAPVDAVLAGVDGLALFGADLIGIQNGVLPHRVLRISVDTAGMKVTRVEILEMNHPAFDEPTLGAVTGRDFYFIANSQWERYSEDGKVRKGALLRPPLVLKRSLEPSR